MNLKVTTASRLSEEFMGVPAAMYVLTEDDIRRSGAQTLPEMLRLVPGIHVSMLDGSKHQVSIRGFAGRFSNKLQVLIDGRSIYSPLFSGVFWESNLVSPSEIKRIEVVRGPGAALWGPNALNGVINIITKSAELDQGTEATAGTGSSATSLAEAKYGGKLGDKAWFKVFARRLGAADTELPSGSSSADGWLALHGSARLDWKPTDRDHVSFNLRLDEMDGSHLLSLPTLTAPFRQTTRLDFENTSYSLAGFWQRSDGDSRLSTAKMSFSTSAGNPIDQSTARVSVLDVGFEESRKSGSANTVFGINYRHYSDANTGTNFVALIPAEKKTSTFSAFGQVEKKLGSKFKANLGLTLEHNDFTGFEFQPSLRALWERSDTETYWAAISRAVRTPTRVDNDFMIHYISSPGPALPFKAEVLGSDDFESEEVLSVEIGSRIRPSAAFYWDVTAFYNKYSNLRGTQMGTPYMSGAPTPHIVVPYQLVNNRRGQTGGIEAAFAYKPNSRLRLDGGAAFFTESYNDSGIVNGVDLGLLVEGRGATPSRSLTLRGQYLLSDRLTLDLSLLHSAGITRLNRPNWTRIDAQIAWNPTLDLTFFLGGADLFGSSRVEGHTSLFEVPSAVGRSWSMRMSYRF